MVHLDTKLLNFFHEQLIFAISKTTDSLGCRRIGGASIRKLDVRGGEEADHAIVAWLPIHVVTVVAFDVEWQERFSQARSAGFEELIEQLLPGGSVNARGKRDYPVQVKDHCFRAILCRLGEAGWVARDRFFFGAHQEHWTAGTANYHSGCSRLLAATAMPCHDHQIGMPFTRQL